MAAFTIPLTHKITKLKHPVTKHTQTKPQLHVNGTGTQKGIQITRNYLVKLM